MQPKDFIDHASLIAHEEDAERMTSPDMVVSILTETEFKIVASGIDSILKKLDK